MERISATVDGMEIPYYSFGRLRKTGKVIDGFSTRFGGVSKNHLASMNLGVNRGDDWENVYTNFDRMARALGVNVEDLVLSKQTHTTNVVVVDENYKGNGITRENIFNDVDGMITNTKGVVLVTSYADCVPLYFVDPVNEVIGLSHSGWRGTVNKMGLCTVTKMVKEFGCNPKNIIGAIGPSICQNCYEVSEDVIEAFKDNFNKNDYDKIFYQRKDNPDKYQLNLWEANKLVMLEAGLEEENIIVSSICTCENSDIFFSHRATNGLRGNVCAFLGLKS